MRICTGDVWCAQNLAVTVFVRLHEERVVHLPGRVAFRKVQRGEIVVVGFDLRTFGNRKSHISEDGGNFVRHLADRMNAAGLGRGLANRKGDIRPLTCQTLLEGSTL